MTNYGFNFSYLFFLWYVFLVQVCLFSLAFFFLYCFSIILFLLFPLPLSKVVWETALKLSLLYAQGYFFFLVSVFTDILSPFSIFFLSFLVLFLWFSFSFLLQFSVCISLFISFSFNCYASLFLYLLFFPFTFISYSSHFYFLFFFPFLFISYSSHFHLLLILPIVIFLFFPVFFILFYPFHFSPIPPAFVFLPLAPKVGRATASFWTRQGKFHCLLTHLVSAAPACEDILKK